MDVLLLLLALYGRVTFAISAFVMLCYEYYVISLCFAMPSVVVVDFVLLMYLVTVTITLLRLQVTVTLLQYLSITLWQNVYFICAICNAVV